jgi:hypothetical protein
VILGWASVVPHCERPLPARLAHCRASRRRSFDRTDSSHTTVAAPAALHVPFPDHLAQGGLGQRRTVTDTQAPPLQSGQTALHQLCRLAGYPRREPGVCAAAALLLGTAGDRNWRHRCWVDFRLRIRRSAFATIWVEPCAS